MSLCAVAKGERGWHIRFNCYLKAASEVKWFLWLYFLSELNTDKSSYRSLCSRETFHDFFCWKIPKIMPNILQEVGSSRVEVGWATVTARLGHLTGPPLLSYYTWTGAESSYWLKYAWKNIQDILLLLTFSVADHHTCTCNQIHCKDVVFKLLEWRFCQTMLRLWYQDFYQKSRTVYNYSWRSPFSNVWFLTGLAFWQKKRKVSE